MNEAFSVTESYYAEALSWWSLQTPSYVFKHRKNPNLSKDKMQSFSNIINPTFYPQQDIKKHILS